MADLRITGVSNNQLELQAPDGTRHYLEISDDLLKALKSRPTTLPATLTPREIQAEIRLGSSVEDLVAKYGADEDQILKFAAPIITELKHIVTLARNIRLSLAGDRFTDPTQIEFGTVMDERLEANKATNVRWTSKKSVEGEWLVSAEFDINGEPGIATWSFDPKNLYLVPENQSALQLSNAAPLSLASTQARPQVDLPVHPTNLVTTLEVVEEQSTHTAGLTVVPELVEVETTETETRTEVITVVETETRTTFHVVEDHAHEVLGILEQPQQEQIEEVYEEAPTETSEQAEVEEDPKVEELSSVSETPVEEPKPQSTSRWAEVLFGSKDEED